MSRENIEWDASPHDLRGATILVVDDEPDARSMLRVLFEGCGAEVLLAANADEAVLIVERDHPTILVSDIGMPEDDGYCLLRRVRELSVARGGAIPAVALTAYARAEDRVKAISAGFQMHIAKPVEPAELLAMVSSLIKSSRSYASQLR